MKIKNVKDMEFEDFSDLIKEYVKVGFGEYKTFHKYGNEDEDSAARWDEIKVGSEVYLDGDDTSASVTDVESHKEGTSFSMYTIETLEKGDVVFANNVLVAVGEEA